MKSWITTALVILAVIAIPKAVTYMIGAVQTQQQVTQINQRAEDKKSEPVISSSEAKAEWMTGCDTESLGGATFNQTEYCGCTFDRLEKRYGVNKLLQLFLNSSEQEIENLITPDANTCMAEQGIEV